MTWSKATSASRGYGHRWRALRVQAMRRDNGLCQRCLERGRVTPGTECDHVVSKAAGGKDTLDNVRMLCSACHEAKSIEDRGGKRRPRIGADGYPMPEE